MPRRHLLLAAATTILLLARAASAQPVYIFDEAPSLEQLRSIVIPESRGGLSRSIVLQNSASAALPSPVQRVASPPVAPVSRPAPQTTAPVAAAKAAAPQRPSDNQPEAGTVGFRINFGFDSAVLPPSGRGFVDRIGELMKDSPQLRLRVEGHTDAKGTAEYNLELSKRRALSVAEYLVAQHGIAPERLVLVGKGMTEPLVEDGTDPRNRRVQFVRLD
jgi:outer membrane protein OmpA-like peptidoglycan-associated protein